MPRKLEAYFQEILNSISEIKSFIGGIDIEQYSGDAKTKAAVERKFLNIGEALNQANEVDNEIENYVAEFRKIVGFRNILAHGYFGVDDTLVWSIVTTKLESLKKDIEALTQKTKKNMPTPHPWRACPYGEHWVKTHPLHIPPNKTHPDGSVTTRHQHCAHNLSGKDQLYPDEIREIAKQHFSDLENKPCPLQLKFGAKGSKYDDLIAGWVQYWNDVLKPDVPLDPNLIKALVASESGFDANRLVSKNDSNSARGLTQITNATRKLLDGDKGQLKDHFITATKADLNDPSVNICAGVRWLFETRRLTSSRLKKSASWADAVWDYKGTRGKPKEDIEKIKKIFNNFYRKYQECAKK
jgi:uncharacterized protein with HEPN domain